MCTELEAIKPLFRSLSQPTGDRARSAAVGRASGAVARSSAAGRQHGAGCAGDGHALEGCAAGDSRVGLRSL